MFEWMKEMKMNVNKLTEVIRWINNNPDHELVRKLQGNQDAQDYWDRVKAIFVFVEEHGSGKVVQIDWSKSI